MNLTAFFTSLVTWYIAFPAAVLCLAPMKNHFRAELRKVLPPIIITLTASALLIAVLKSLFVIPRNALMPLMVIPSFLIYVKSITAPVYKSLSVFVLVYAFMSFLANIANGFDALLHPHATLNEFSLQAAFFLAVISTVFAIISYYPASHQAVTIIDRLDFPRAYYASAPVWGIFLAFNLLISPRRYETLHVNLMQIAYWGCLLLFFTLLCLLCVLFNYIVTDILKKADMEERARMLEMQESVFLAQQRYIEESARVRHDFKHTIAALNELSQKGDITAIRAYIDEYLAAQPAREQVNFCRDLAVNAVLNHYRHSAGEHRIRLDWEIDLPDDPFISDVDLCSIIGNILENAILACMEVPEADRFIELGIRTERSSDICLVATNSFNGKVRMKDGQYLSTRSAGHGIGLKSITSTAAKYGGTSRFHHEGREFCIDVILCRRGRLLSQSVNQGAIP